MRELTENLDGLIAESPLLLLQYGDDACGPCHAIRFRLDRWLEGRNINARYVDIRKHLECCAQRNIFSVPTVAVYMDGRLMVQESGCFSLEKLLERAERYMEMRESGA